MEMAVSCFRNHGETCIMEQLWRFHGGVHPEQHKALSTRHPVQTARLPKRLTLPLNQHIGELAEPIVKPGDKVLKGQMIARASGYVSAPVHAPTSGTVLDVGQKPIPHPSGLSALSIVIESDGEDRWVASQAVADYTSLDPSALRNIVREAGIVGLGGAGFPTYIKLNPSSHKSVKTLILNGVECEPYITCDDMLMRERADEIVSGMRIILHALQAEECVIAIEDNKPEAYEAMVAATRNEQGVTVKHVPTIYPEGSEKQLVQVLTGQEVPSNGLAIHVGVVCQNVGTAAAVHRAIHHGEPLISRFITVTGSGVKEPRNMEVLFGTSMSELIEQCGGDIDHLDRLIMGGPMMGFALHDTHLPVIKTTNCIIAATRADLPQPRPVMPCIRCGACADACPVSLLPQQLYWYAKHKELDKVQEYNLFDCIECGCCSYVCPSNIPLVQYYRFAKGEIWIKEREREKSDIARQRFEFRNQRLETEKAERETRRSKKKAALKTGNESDTHDATQTEIKAAMERVQSKQEIAKTGNEKNAENTAE